MKIGFVTLGCSKNLLDTEVMLHELYEAGYEITPEETEADIVVIDMPLLDTRRGKDLLGTFLSDIVLQVLSFVAENERANIRSRQREGIEAARERGVRFGRPVLPMPEDFEEIIRALRKGEITAAEAARRCGFSRATLYSRIAKLENGSRDSKQESGQ